MSGQVCIGLGVQDNPMLALVSAGATAANGWRHNNRSARKPLHQDRLPV